MCQVIIMVHLPNEYYGLPAEWFNLANVGVYHGIIMACLQSGYYGLLLLIAK